MAKIVATHAFRMLEYLRWSSNCLSLWLKYFITAHNWRWEYRLLLSVPTTALVLPQALTVLDHPSLCYKQQRHIQWVHRDTSFALKWHPMRNQNWVCDGVCHQCRNWNLFSMTSIPHGFFLPKFHTHETGRLYRATRGPVHICRYSF